MTVNVLNVIPTNAKGFLILKTIVTKHSRLYAPIQLKDLCILPYNF